jgi:ABC-type proline/glycine betaine transport system permease subunit
MRSDLAHDLIQLTAEHLLLVVSSMAIALLIGIPLGILLSRHVRPRKWLLGFASIMQTIPSLALFGFLIPIPFIGGIGYTRCFPFCGTHLWASPPSIRPSLNPPSPWA